MNFQQWSIGKKLFLLSSCLSAALLAVGYVNYFNEEKLGNALAQVAEVEMPALRNMALVDMMHDGIRGAVMSGLYASTTKDTKAMKEAIEDSKHMGEKVETLVAEIERLPLGETSQKAIEEVRPHLKAYVASAQKILETASTNKDADLKNEVELFNEAFSKLEASLENLGNLIEKHAEVESKKAASVSKTSQQVGFWLLIIGVFSGAILSLGIARGLISALGKIVSRLESEARALGHNSQEMTSASTNLSNSAATQASAVQETAASLEEIGSMVRKTEEHARHLMKIVENSFQATAEGKKSMHGMLNAMDGIQASNKEILTQTEANNREIEQIVKVIAEIGEKTKVINDIVFQTKLLSFNASVEAARAGEHGKGFSVVAEEVGNLAQMSGNAAKEIADMLAGGIERAQRIVVENRARVENTLRNGQERVQNGVEIAKQCDKLFDVLSNHINDVNSMTTQISSAIHEQAQGTEEITKAVHLFNSSSQQTQSISAQSSSIANGLLGQAATISEIMQNLTQQVGQSASKHEDSFVNDNKIEFPKGKNGLQNVA